MILCDNTFLSVGGGYVTLCMFSALSKLTTSTRDGKYGLWLDDIFEKGVSQPCMTFGNEPLSEEGEKFDIIGVELWKIG